jgi:hypothetical protein
MDAPEYDSGPSPYGVLGGFAIADRDVWNLIKAKKLVSAQVFRQARLTEPIAIGERQVLARQCLTEGAGSPRRCVAALAQAKLSYVAEVLDTCARFRCRAFASMVDKDAPLPAPDHLRKDYAYLFERFFYFLEEAVSVPAGFYRSRVSSHSDLTTGVQIADLIAYILSWGMRFRPMTKPARAELAGYVSQVCQPRYRAVREVDGNPQFTVWSFAFITDLRSQLEREIE